MSTIVLIAGAIAGIAGFRENISKLFPEEPHIVLHAQIPEGGANPINLVPTDSSLIVQEIRFHWPGQFVWMWHIHHATILEMTTTGSFGFPEDPRKDIPVMAEVLNEGATGKVGRFDCDFGDDIPVMFVIDFISKDGKRRKNRELYTFTLNNPELDGTPEGSVLIRRVSFDRDIGSSFDIEQEGVRALGCSGPYPPEVKKKTPPSSDSNK